MVEKPHDYVKTTYDVLCASANAVGPYTCLYENFRDRILGVEPAHPTQPATFEDAVIGQRILDAVRESDRSGGWIALD